MIYSRNHYPSTRPREFKTVVIARYLFPMFANLTVVYEVPPNITYMSRGVLACRVSHFDKSFTLVQGS